MPRSRCTAAQPDPLPSPELLEILAERLVEAQLTGDSPGAALVRVRPTPEGIDLGLWPLPAGAHPVDALVGTTVGPPWSAVGVVTEGAARHAGAGPTDGGGAGAVQSGPPVVVAVLVGRDGRVAHRIVPRIPTPLSTTSEPPEGRLVDCLRRTLGLATPPPSTASGPWWATLWLDRIVAEAATEPTRRRTLVSLGELHPLVGPDLSARAATLLHRIEPGPSVAGWEVMRSALGATDVAARSVDQTIRRALLPLVSSDQARWFDQGSFARWLEAALPSRPVLLAATDALLAPRLAQALREAVAG